MKTQSDQNGTTSKKSERVRRKQYLLDGPKYGTEELRAALFHVQEMLERSQLKFVLLDELADQLVNRENPELSASEVSVGVRMQDFTESGSSILRSLIPEAGWKEFIHGHDINNLSYSVGSVPVVIWMIHNDVEVFKNPDVRFYYNTEFYIPNPFREYWKTRFLIK